VFFNDDVFLVVDTGNHRVLLWHDAPREDGQPADVVLGQKSFDVEGPNSAGTGAENGMYLPTAAGVWEGKLFIADAWHHRVLVWNEVPRRSNTPPDCAIGQPDLASVDANRGGATGRGGLWCPYGMAWIQGRFYVADTSNRRVVGWDGIPEPGQLPDSLLGQPAWESGEESRGEGVGPRSFRWPHAIAGIGEYAYVADAGNHRILGWRGDLTRDRDADVLLGQADMTQAQEFAYRPQGPAKLRFPYALSSDGQSLAVGDTANNRVLFWETLPSGEVTSRAAAAVIGQPSFEANGENHWKAVTRESMCWPYGICWHKDRLAIADSGNNRVMLWSAANIGSEVVEPEAAFAV
jgi:hypothetical protein